MTSLRVRRRHRLGPLVALAAIVCLPTAGSAQDASAGAGASIAASPMSSIGPTPDEQLAAARAQVRELTAERDRLQQTLATFDELYEPMDAYRQLLVELRKQLPEDRADAESYLQRMGSLATASDPARLGQLADRVLETAPVFLEWRHTEFATPEEANQAYLTSGAAGFNTDFDELKNAILLTVANRLDALLTMQDRIR